MSEPILILSDRGIGRASEPFVVVDCRTDAAERLGRGDVRAVCLDRSQVDDALSDARWLRRRRNRLPVLAWLDSEQVRRVAELLAVGVEDVVVREPNAQSTLISRLEGIERRRTRVAGMETPSAVVARSPAMRLCMEQVAKAQRSQATVLLQGETGTGKEVIARLIHGGGRREGAFVAINCAAFPETLLESELFGYERGAFTGADRAHRGHFEQADAGTLFLDEVAETSFAFQVKLLRVLQEGTLRPLGSSEERRVDVRILAATNRDLAHAVETGEFRRDLFYRLNVLSISLPPLRSRTEDIVPLTRGFLERSCEPDTPRGVAADARALLETYAWPGNVRELENEVARVLAAASGEDEISARMLSPAIQGMAPALPPDPGAETLRETVGRLEAWVLRRALERHAGRRIATARSLGITRECLYKKLRRHGLQ